MSGAFSQNSPFVRFLTKAFDLMLLNILTVVCCIPLFTAGAALTAHAYVLLHMTRDEESYIIRSFFRSFRENFLKAAVFECIYIAVGLLLYAEWKAVGMMVGDVHAAFRGFFIVLTVVAAAMMMYTFPLLARFENTIRGTLKTAFFCTVGLMPRTVFALLIAFSVAVLYWYFNVQILPILILFGFTLPGYLVMAILGPGLKKLEGETNTD